ncbi:MAG TPA: hypothetical protein VFE32_15000 [Puia sp.]|jgi:hypothetical protein|nr:hypothetical protein [Puia sp.]
MHYRTLLTPALLLALHVSAQSPARLSALHSVTILLHPASQTTSILAASAPIRSFSHFEVIDERPDTSRIGIHTCIPDFGRNYDRQLIFERSTRGAIADYLNRHFACPGSPYTALVILRTLWLSDANYARAEYIRHPEHRLERTHIRLKAEIYAIRDERYIPVLRFDTLQTAMKRRILRERSSYFEWGANLALLMNDLADSSSRLAREKAVAGRWVDLDDIRQFNASRFNAPIDDDQPARGVYANFEEFRNNTPSIQNFEIKLEDRKRLLYIRESGTTYYTHDAWGYCDGKDIYIMRDGVLCPAWKEGKAFYLPAGAATANSLTVTHDRDYKQRSIYFVDMDTGDIY